MFTSREIHRLPQIEGVEKQSLCKNRDNYTIKTLVVSKV